MNCKENRATHNVGTFRGTSSKNPAQKSPSHGDPLLITKQEYSLTNPLKSPGESTPSPHNPYNFHPVTHQGESMNEKTAQNIFTPFKGEGTR
jgi:hypothetical protein